MSFFLPAASESVFFPFIQPQRFFVGLQADRTHFIRNRSCTGAASRSFSFSSVHAPPRLEKCPPPHRHRRLSSFPTTRFPHPSVSSVPSGLDPR